MAAVTAPTPGDPPLVTLDDVQRAAARLGSVAQRTPVEESRAISGIVGARTVLKCEHLQRTGSFKIRGAYNRIVQLTEDEQRRGVVCASAGNHAQGVALSAALAGVPATVFMPVGAPLPKVEATRSYGAEVVLTGETFDDAASSCAAWAQERGAVLVHPFDHPDVVAGQGTIGLEILEQLPEATTVVTAVGGGGLVSGIATAVKALRPDVRVVGVQAAGVSSVRPALEGRAPRADESGSTIADGIAVKEPAALTLAHIRARVDEIVTVSDQSIARAALLLVERAKQVVEPAGAAGLAALLEGSVRPDGPIVVVLGGGNIDPMLLMRIIRSGMTEEGRTFAFRTQLPDVPGALSRLVALIAAQGANIVAVEHHRYGARLDVQEVEVYLELETRGSEHIAKLREALTTRGYVVD